MIVVKISPEISKIIKVKKEVSDRLNVEFMYVGSAFKIGQEYYICDLMCEETDSGPFFATIDKEKVINCMKKCALGDRIPVLIHSHTVEGIKRFSEQDNQYEKKLIKCINYLYDYDEIVSILFFDNRTIGRITTLEGVLDVEVHA